MISCNYVIHILYRCPTVSGKINCWNCLKISCTVEVAATTTEESAFFAVGENFSPRRKILAGFGGSFWVFFKRRKAYAPGKNMI
jgi:hypothetical protein